MACATSGVSTCGMTMPSAPASRQRVPKVNSPCGIRTSGAMPASSAATLIWKAVSTEVARVLQVDEQPVEASCLHHPRYLDAAHAAYPHAHCQGVLCQALPGRIVHLHVGSPAL